MLITRLRLSVQVTTTANLQRYLAHYITTSDLKKISSIGLRISDGQSKYQWKIVVWVTPDVVQ